MEASALQAPAALAPTRTSLRTPLLRLRSDEQLVALFRAGHDEAFRVIHDRYRQRLFAYTRQMLPRRQDAEDALQDVFERAYAGLRASDRQLALRAWLYRVAHNRCIDELRRPPGPPAEVLELVRAPVDDPAVATVQRESFSRLIADVGRLPDHQRSTLLMRELGGMSYSDMADALGVTVPAVKSLLVRARMALAQALAARDTACSEIREELSLAHDRGARPGAMARRHMRDCAGCREFRRDLRGVSRQLAALSPGLGPLGVVAKLLGIGGGASGGTAAASTGGAVASAGALASGVGHVATLLAATVVTAGGAVEIQKTMTAPPHHRHQVHASAGHATKHAAPPAQAVTAGAYVAAATQPVSAAAASLPQAATIVSPPSLVPPARPLKTKAAVGTGSTTKAGDKGAAAASELVASGADAIGLNASATGPDVPGTGSTTGSDPSASGGTTGPDDTGSGAIVGSGSSSTGTAAPGDGSLTGGAGGAAPTGSTSGGSSASSSGAGAASGSTAPTH